MMTDEEREADLRRAIELEKIAADKLREMMAQIGKGLSWYWGWGDGEGGYVLNLLRTQVVEAGYIWPFDPKTSGGMYRKAKISRSLSKAVFERDAYRCVTCGGHQDLCCDHAIPESKGGPTTLDNLQTMCRPCNSRKGNR